MTLICRDFEDVIWITAAVSLTGVAARIDNDLRLDGFLKERFAFYAVAPMLVAPLVEHGVELVVPGLSPTVDSIKELGDSFRSILKVASIGVELVQPRLLDLFLGRRCRLELFPQLGDLHLHLVLNFDRRFGRGQGLDRREGLQLEGRAVFIFRVAANWCKHYGFRAIQTQALVQSILTAHRYIH